MGWGEGASVVCPGTPAGQRDSWGHTCRTMCICMHMYICITQACVTLLARDRMASDQTTFQTTAQFEPILSLVGVAAGAWEAHLMMGMVDP